MKQSSKRNKNSFPLQEKVLHFETHHICKTSEVCNTSALMKRFIHLPRITGKQPEGTETTLKIPTPFLLLIKIPDAIHDEI